MVGALGIRLVFTDRDADFQSMIEFRIDDEYAGVRLDKFLKARLSTVPHSHLFKMIRTKKVRVNGKRAFPEQTLQLGDLLAIRGDEQQLLTPQVKPKPKT